MHFARNHPSSILTTALLAAATIATGQLGAGTLALLCVSSGLLAVSESLMGPARVAASVTVVSVIGIGTGILAQSIGVVSDSYSVGQIDAQHVLDPLIPAVCALMAATAFTRRVTRDRVRTIGFCLLIVFALYSGQPSDLYRLAAAAAGFTAGIVLARRAHRRPARVARDRPEGRILLASIVTISAIGPAVSALAPVTLGLLAPLGSLFGDSTDLAGGAAPSADSQGALLVSLIPLLVQIVAAYGIVKGRRLALWVTIVINTLLTVFAACFYLPIIFAEAFGTLVAAETSLTDLTLPMLVSIAVPLGIAILSVRLLSSFPSSQSGRPARRFFVGVTVAWLASAVGYLVVMAVSGASTGTSLGESLIAMVTRFIPEGFLTFEPALPASSSPVAHLFFDFTGTAFWVAVLVLAGWQIFRNRTHPAETSTSNVRILLQHGFGTGPLSWMTTWAGHEYWHAEHVDAAVAYRVVNGVAIVTGLPVCEPDMTAAVIRSFGSFARHRGWIPVFYGVPESNRQAFPADDWSALKVAEETVLSVDGWSLSGRSMQDTRSAITRAGKLGVFSRWVRYADLSAIDMMQIDDISEQWAQAKALPEMGFTLGGVREMHDPAVRLLIAQDHTSRIHAVTSWLPTYRADSVDTWTLDFMRRAPQSMSGVMEFLIAEMMTVAQATNAQRVSLSAAPLANTRQLDEGIAGRGTALLSRMLEPVYGFQSLQHFKSKFRPAMTSLFLMYPDPAALPSIGLGLARAYLPDLTTRRALAYLRAAR
ncbi:MAG: lysX [Subtercola sp.]|nr:lysX [Subtercola sp.]